MAKANQSHDHWNHYHYRLTNRRHRLTNHRRRLTNHRRHRLTNHRRHRLTNHRHRRLTNHRHRRLTNHRHRLYLVFLGRPFPFFSVQRALLQFHVSNAPFHFYRPMPFLSVPFRPPFLSLFFRLQNQGHSVQMN
ncbi:hypothetical protein NEISICOT_03555 [Neisseria sicca ATCC 29256]|uniref:Uncharacterized protein n=1 Tax=Neisseria sicca ATCC 29256 TaxID=547045 RepID=C6MAH3_NEISI|nr:hypothetical protein NEISICOT_03555 [Neisseria sicca ATCC 29256]